MGRGEAYTGFWWGNSREKDHFENRGIDERITLRRSSGIGMWGLGLDRAGSG
jgi:hypothetical protein